MNEAGEADPAAKPGRRFGWEVPAVAALGVLACVLLFWGLGEKYLWQDEAATAVLGERMLVHGRPLAWDGRNFVSNDLFSEKDSRHINEVAKTPQEAVDYFVKRGDYKADSAWKFHPWGQFVVAAAGLKVFGHSTLGARLPFALAGLATIALLYALVRRAFDSPLMAVLAVFLLVLNSYWIMHSRQARYYPLATCMLVATLAAYAHWQRGGRGGAFAFVVAAWSFFNVDYGTIVPVLVVLFVDSIAANRKNLPKTLAAWTGLAVALAPLALFYGLADSSLHARVSAQSGSWFGRWSENLSNMNTHVAPVVVVLAAAALLSRRWKSLPQHERRLVSIACGLYAALMLWIPSVAPYPFLRYVILLAPAGCALSAWVLVRGCGDRAPRLAPVGALLLAVTPWFSLPASAVLPLLPASAGRETGWLVRAEFRVVASEVFGSRPDPNRIVAEWLRNNAAPDDEILINYEDVPLMFYLPNPIRGGIAAFRVEDDSRTPPRFAVIRRSIDFVDWTVFNREIQRYQWTPVPLHAPDVAWGNNPDPIAATKDPSEAPDMLLLRRHDEAGH